MTYSRTNKGFTLVEVLVYSAGAVFVIGTISAFIFYSFGWYRSIAIPSRADQVGESLVDRIKKDVRSGRNISSILAGTDTGSLTLNVLISPSVTATKSYAIQGQRIIYTENGQSSDLIPNDMKASALRFAQSISTSSTAVHFSFSLNYQTKNGPATSTYSGYAILRNSYQ